ncbi:hypothetical protein VOLCADRAFT_104179 [Volvox carteri f. nagariensis]|uniref:Uncharacterized protein n=1 Tax=Volvox carteri f. nagariensis TaxID=3068 RepID=D8TRY9_VOLCA|nr:uncharacterized protein VOLCADRAFT_104179 [Volvox carteri f. nagariensis]EFJ49602.1 hypothetical protein VOLCADRAFT_104179 [Volvox carteri f. nagariensis]|eukprot:XP_002949109.1 hypothetical protein VOLCADRAFT_104179 [Volvox carteri f. nagariensis]
MAAELSRCSYDSAYAELATAAVSNLGQHRGDVRFQHNSKQRSVFTVLAPQLAGRHFMTHSGIRARLRSALSRARLSSDNLAWGEKGHAGFWKGPQCMHDPDRMDTHAFRPSSSKCRRRRGIPPARRVSCLQPAAGSNIASGGKVQAMAERLARCGSRVAFRATGPPSGSGGVAVGLSGTTSGTVIVSHSLMKQRQTA